VLYLATFGVTLALVFACRRWVPALDERSLVDRVPGGRVYHPHRLWSMVAFLLCLTPLFFLSAVREGIGTDYYYTYTPRFLEILEGERTYYEIGFYWFNRVLGMFTDNPQWVFVTTSFIYMLCLGLAYYDAVDDLPFCIVILLVSGEYFVSLNNLRQAMASAILLLSFHFIRRGKWIPAFLLTALCSTLHQAMLLFFAVWVILILLKWIPLHRMLLLLSAGALLVYILLSVVPEFAEILFPERLLYYIKEAMYTEPTIGWPRGLMNAALLAFLLFTRYRAQDKRLDPMVIMQFLAVVVCLFDALLPAAYRILRLFTFWQLLSLPIAMERYSAVMKDRWWIKLLLIVLLGALCVHAIVIMRTEQVLPYRSIFHE